MAVQAGAGDPRAAGRAGRRADREFQARHAARSGASPTNGSTRTRRASCAARSPATARRGPKAALPGYDFILQAESGLMSICGDAGRRADQIRCRDRRHVHRHARLQRDPRRAQRAPPHRARPESRSVAVTSHRSPCSSTSRRTISIAGTRRRALRQWPSEHRAVHDLSGPDGMIAVAVGNDAQFARFAALLGHPEWAKDARFTRQPRPRRATARSSTA